MVPPAKAEQLIASGEVEVIYAGPRRKKTLRWFTPSEPEPKVEPSHPRRQYAEPHRQETHENIEGIWTFDRIPERHRPLFTGVLASITTSEQPHDTDTQRSAEPLPQELLKAA